MDRFWTVNPCWKLRTLQSITAYRGLWKQCYGQGGTAGDFNTECNKYTQGIAELARSGLVGQRALVCLSFIFCLFGLISGTASTEAVNLAKSKKSKNKSAGKVFSVSVSVRIMTHLMVDLITWERASSIFIHGRWNISSHCNNLGNL